MSMTVCKPQSKLMKPLSRQCTGREEQCVLNLATKDHHAHAHKRNDQDDEDDQELNEIARHPDESLH